MTLQNVLDQQAIDMLPHVKNAITNAAAFEANQMRMKALQTISDSVKPIANMNELEKIYFQDDLLRYFKNNNWIEG